MSSPIENRPILTQRQRESVRKHAIHSLQQRSKTRLPKAEIHTVRPASVHKMNPDTLFLIFIQACQDNWKAPITLGAVCSRWRTILLETPQAWAFFRGEPYPSSIKHPLIDLWISRCATLRLHLSFHPQSAPLVVAAACRHEENIQCLSLFNNSKRLLGQFAQMEELRLGREDLHLDTRFYKQLRGQEIKNSELKPLGEGFKGKKNKNKNMQPSRQCLLDMKRYPKLRSLHLHSPAFETMRGIANYVSFPPLQELHIHAHTKYWISIIRHCASHLVTLAIETSKTSQENSPEERKASVVLPKLRNLHYIIKHTSYTPLQFPTLETPQLQVYHHINDLRVLPLHADIVSVKTLILGKPNQVKWSAFPSVDHVQISAEVGIIMGFINQLVQSDKLCPNLTSIECVSTTSSINRGKIAKSMRKRTSMTGKSINIRYPTEESYKHYSVCYTSCQCQTSLNEKIDSYGEYAPRPAAVKVKIDYGNSDRYSSSGYEAGSLYYDGATRDIGEGFPCKCGEWHSYDMLCGDWSD